MKIFRKVLSILLTTAILSGICAVQASAASTRKCYTISSGNTRLTKKYGTIYGSDEVTVLLVKDAYCKVRYPISRGRTKTGYIRTSMRLSLQLMPENTFYSAAIITAEMMWQQLRKELM
jgi:hypothetical protein